MSLEERRSKSFNRSYLGVKYINDCPVQPNLPVYLLVVGSMGLVRLLNLLWKQFRRRRMRKFEGYELDQEEETENSSYSFSYSVLFKHELLLFRWFGFYRCCSESFSSRLVHRGTILDMECLHAEFRIRTRKSQSVL